MSDHDLKWSLYFEYFWLLKNQIGIEFGTGDLGWHQICNSKQCFLRCLKTQIVCPNWSNTHKPCVWGVWAHNLDHQKYKRQLAHQVVLNNPPHTCRWARNHIISDVKRPVQNKLTSLSITLLGHRWLRKGRTFRGSHRMNVTAQPHSYQVRDTQAHTAPRLIYPLLSLI